MGKTLEVMPTKEELEWYISGGSGGKDGQGVAVRFYTELGRLIPDHNFGKRISRWRESLPTDYQDPYWLAEMPDLNLLNDYLNHRAIFNLETHSIETIY